MRKPAWHVNEVITAHLFRAAVHFKQLTMHYKIQREKTKLSNKTLQHLCFWDAQPKADLTLQ